MARTSGSNNFAGTLEILASSALDARDIVQTKADLTASGSFPYPYVGMETYVVSENKKYRLIADDPTEIDNWEEVGSGGGSTDVELTQDEYDALPASKETDGINYFVKDGIPASQRIVETGFTPVGTIISVMGTTAPQHYLACDGTIVNIADYPVLAAYFEEQFGSSNFFGGDGETTFALPDLRGEFLRGTGTNSHANQGSGGSVGAHQDATELLSMGVDGSGKLLHRGSETYWANTYKADSQIGISQTKQYSCSSVASDVTATISPLITSRPTNTSVLYCIATKNIYVDARFDYSLDEKVVGTWIDGKPLYQKTIYISSFVDTAGTTKSTVHGITNFGFLVNMFGVTKMDNGVFAPLMYVSNFSDGNSMASCSASVSVSDANIATNTKYSRLVGQPAYITLQYTKTTT